MTKKKKKKVKKEHKHVWTHKTKKGRCMHATCKKIHTWLIHKCRSCGKETSGVLIE